MEKIELGNELIKISVGDGNNFIHIETEGYGNDVTLMAPVFEVDGTRVGGDNLKLIGKESEKDLSNGGREVGIKFSFMDQESLSLIVLLRFFPQSPFVRFKYIVMSDETGNKLTKRNGKDGIEYTGVTIPANQNTRLTEVQFSQFESIVHSFIPNFQLRDQVELTCGIDYPGPITFVESDQCCYLIAYEHGAEYPDSNLSFSAKKNDNNLEIKLAAAKGNYYDGQVINQSQLFETVWFHAAISSGNKTDLLKDYRVFFMKYICENNESRKPYIFYNTWNNQERNKYYKKLPYLYSMHLDQILEEIDVAHRMGIDVFVIDTGWYNKTGEWSVNLERFPDGMKKVKEKLDLYGMKLGLWFNPIVAAKTSQIYKEHPEYVITLDGKEKYVGKVWETEESYGMCLASGYSDFFIEKLIQLNRDLGVTYFKWDAVDQYGCNSPLHNHGTEANSPQERLECYSYKMGMEMIRIVEQVTLQCPDIIIDFDITEGGRFVGLGFLSVGKYFLMNNGPYFSSFDIPNTFKMEPDTINVFFHPGAARAKVCRQGLRFDSFIPSILFLTHFLPDAPIESQITSLASLMLGGNGIWGDLLSLTDADIDLFHETLLKYKKVANNINDSYPKIKGFIGSSPEIYEKIEYNEAKGIICFFTRAKGTFVHVTEAINRDNFVCVDGADHYEWTQDNKLVITVTLEQNESRYVFVM